VFLRVIGGVVLFLVLVLFSEPCAAEWYVGAYGGFSSPSDLTSVTMPDFGRRSALNDPLLAPAANPALASVTQTFKTSDIKTNTSPIFGGKVGYFFDQQQFPWLGVELEVFTTKPDIEAQVVQTKQDIQFNPVNIAPTGICDVYPTLTPTCPQLIRKEGSLEVPSSSLRVFTAAANVLVRYPGRWFEPYAGVGIGAFYFRGTGPIAGDQVVPGLNALGGIKLFPTTDWGFFVEGKYNRATITSLDSTFGISGTYDVFHVVSGVLYRF
jgi:opacity protein-like surface antigen